MQHSNHAAATYTGRGASEEPEGNAENANRWTLRHPICYSWHMPGPAVPPTKPLIWIGSSLRDLRFQPAVYVLHAFQKKSKSGIATPKAEMDKIRRRLDDARRDHEERYERPHDQQENEPSEA
jgi:hypothetical protein